MEEKLMYYGGCANGGCSITHLRGTQLNWDSSLSMQQCYYVLLPLAFSSKSLVHKACLLFGPATGLRYIAWAIRCRWCDIQADGAISMDITACDNGDVVPQVPNT